MTSDVPAPVLRSRNALRLLGLLVLGLSGVPAHAQATSTEAEKLFPASSSDFAGFGRACRVQGDVALITANGAFNSGAAYCYRRVGGEWTPSQAFMGSQTVQGDFFGFEAVLEGGYAVIGAQQADTPAGNAGEAYVFQDVGGTWVEVQRLTAPDGATSDGFGAALAMVGDLIVVGASGDGDAGASSGSAYVFRRAGATWAFEQKLTASTADVSDQFGWDVATDGQTILVSAVEEEQAGRGATGAVFVFTQVGGTWQEGPRLEPADGEGGDWFGWDIDLDGDVLVVGSVNHDLPFSDSGAVYVYRDDGSAWSLVDKLAPGKLGTAHSLGFSVDVHGDRILAGAPGTGDTVAGALYLFHFDGAGWVEVHQWLTGDEAVPAFPPPQLGMACGMDATTVFGGAPFHDGAVLNSGAAYRFELTDLGLDAVPDSVPPAGVLDLQTSGGLAGAPMAVVLLDISGVPLNLLLWLGAFDVQGQSALPLQIPAAASGLDATFLAAGYWQGTYKALSNPATATFQ